MANKELMNEFSSGGIANNDFHLLLTSLPEEMSREAIIWFYDDGASLEALKILRYREKGSPVDIRVGIMRVSKPEDMSRATCRFQRSGAARTTVQRINGLSSTVSRLLSSLEVKLTFTQRDDHFSHRLLKHLKQFGHIELVKEDILHAESMIELTLSTKTEFTMGDICTESRFKFEGVDVHVDYPESYLSKEEMRTLENLTIVHPNGLASYNQGIRFNVKSYVMENDSPEFLYSAYNRLDQDKLSDLSEDDDDTDFFEDNMHLFVSPQMRALGLDKINPSKATFTIDSKYIVKAPETIVERVEDVAPSHQGIGTEDDSDYCSSSKQITEDKAILDEANIEVEATPKNDIPPSVDETEEYKKRAHDAFLKLHSVGVKIDDTLIVQIREKLDFSQTVNERSTVILKILKTRYRKLKRKDKKKDQGHQGDSDGTSEDEQICSQSPNDPTKQSITVIDSNPTSTHRIRKKPARPAQYPEDPPMTYEMAQEFFETMLRATPDKCEPAEPGETLLTKLLPARKDTGWLNQSILPEIFRLWKRRWARETAETRPVDWPKAVPDNFRINVSTNTISSSKRSQLLQSARFQGMVQYNIGGPSHLYLSRAY